MKQPFSGRFNNIISLASFATTCELETLSDEEIKEAFYKDEEGKKQDVYALSMMDIDGFNFEIDTAKSDCTEDSIFYILNNARTNALVDFERDLLRAISDINQRRLPNYKGTLGGDTSRGIVPVENGQIVTLELVSKELPGAYVEFNKIGLLINQNAVVTVTTNFLDKPINISCKADEMSYTELATPVRHYLDEATVFRMQYTINNFAPRANKLSCGCTKNDALAELFFTRLKDKPAFGLSMGITLKCDVLPSVFAAFENEQEHQTAMQQALRYKALELAIQTIQNSPKIDRYTMMDSEFIMKKRNDYRARYFELVTWLGGAKGIDLSNCACFVQESYTPTLSVRRL